MKNKVNGNRENPPAKKWCSQEKKFCSRPHAKEENEEIRRDMLPVQAHTKSKKIA
jgi:hypothetical protein